MAFSDITDINLEILTWVVDFKLFINLSILNKKSHTLIINTSIYYELNRLKNYDAKLNFDGHNIINIYYELGLINILKKLKKNNKYFISNGSIDYASKNNRVDILNWLKNLDFDLKFWYSTNAIDRASTNGARINYAFTMHN